jgi:teichuronic acid biosynthesis glycosyltransferase TuaG
MFKISIIMPAFNSDLYLEESIKSVLGQTYRNWELIIIDDGSKDKTPEIAQKYADAYPNIIIKRQENKGQAIARNRGIELSSGELITFLDSDDLWMPHTLERLYETLRQEKVDFVFCSFSRLENGQLEDEPLDEFPAGKLKADQMLALLSLYNPLVIHGVLTFRQWVIEAGGFEIKPKLLNCSEDYNLWIRVALLGKSFFGLPTRLAIYRRHAAGTHTNTIKMLEAEIFVHRKYMNNGKTNQLVFKRLLRAKYRRLISAYIKANQTEKAAATFQQLLEFDNGGMAGKCISALAGVLPLSLAHSCGTKLLYPVEYRLMNLLHGNWKNAVAKYKEKITKGI